MGVKPFDPALAEFDSFYFLIFSLGFLNKGLLVSFAEIEPSKRKFLVNKARELDKFSRAIQSTYSNSTGHDCAIIEVRRVVENKRVPYVDSTCK